MSKYKAGDKVVLTVTSTNEMGCLPCYVLNDDLILSRQDIDKYTEPLSTYTEPLERKNENKQKQIEELVDKLHRQAAEITRLLAENKELKNKEQELTRERNQLMGRCGGLSAARIKKFNDGRLAGQNEAWELARKIVLKNGYSAYDLHEIFNCCGSHQALEDCTYQEAAAKVAEWEKAKDEIKVGDILEDIRVSKVKCVVTNLYPDNMAYSIFGDGTAGMHELNNFKKTGRHIDIDGFLKQIGGEGDEK